MPRYCGLSEEVRTYDLDLSPRDEWDAKEGEFAAIFVGFMQRENSRAAA